MTLLGVLLNPLILAILPKHLDINFRMYLATTIVESINSEQQISIIQKVKDYLFKTKEIFISQHDKDGEQNPIYSKMQEYLTGKFCAKLDSCELVSRGGEIEFEVVETVKDTFIDTSEIDSVVHTFMIQVRSEKPDFNGITERRMIINSKTATADAIRKYVKKINMATVRTINKIRVYRPVITKKKDEDSFVQWEHIDIKTGKTLENTIYSEEVEKKIFHDVDKFMNSEEKYIKQGVPYKRGYFLYSEPGQGKTSVAKILAAKYSIPVFCFDIAIINDNNLISKLMLDINYRVSDRYILLIEDFDRTSFISERYHSSRVTMDCFLSALDGIAEPHGRIIIMTANDPTNILDNKALIRPGRIDVCIELIDCDLSQIKRLYNLFYAELEYKPEWDKWEISTNLSAAYVIKVLQENANNPEAFLHIIGTCQDVKTLDPQTEKLVQEAKDSQEQAAGETFGTGRHGRNSRRRGLTTKNRISRAKISIKRTEQNYAKLAKNKERLAKLEAKLIEEKERAKLKKLRESAKQKKKKARKIVDPAAESESDDEFPAFLTNKLEDTEMPIMEILDGLDKCVDLEISSTSEDEPTEEDEFTENSN